MVSERWFNGTRGLAVELMRQRRNVPSQGRGSLLRMVVGISSVDCRCRSTPRPPHLGVDAPCLGAVPNGCSCPCQVGVPGALQGRVTTIQTGSSLKLSTGGWLWNAGRRVQQRPNGTPSLYGLLFGTESSEPSERISTAPCGVRPPDPQTPIFARLNGQTHTA